MASRKKEESIDYGFLIYHHLIKKGKGRFELTPKGKVFLERNAAHKKTITDILHAHNTKWAADRQKLNEILTHAKTKRSSSKAWVFPKPPAKPNKRPRPSH